MQSRMCSTCNREAGPAERGSVDHFPDHDALVEAESLDRRTEHVGRSGSAMRSWAQCMAAAWGSTGALFLRCVRNCTVWRSEEHTFELQSLMRISSAIFCLKKKKALFQT